MWSPGPNAHPARTNDRLLRVARRTRVSHLVQMHTPLAWIAALSGHTSLSVRSRYSTRMEYHLGGRNLVRADLHVRPCCECNPCSEKMPPFTGGPPCPPSAQIQT